MEWAFYAFAAALSRTIKDIGYKTIVQEAGLLEAIFCFWFFALLLLIPLAIKKWQSMRIRREKIFRNRIALFALFACGIFNILGYWVFILALKLGDFSIVVPLRNIVPLFTLILGIFILKEKVTFRIVGATFLILIGAIILHVNSGVFEGMSLWQKITTVPSLLAILSAFFFAVCAMSDRYGMGENYGKMDVLFFTTGTIFLMVIGYGLIVFFKGTIGEVLRIIKIYWPQLFFIGALGAFDTWAIFKAISLGEITKTTPILRVQVLLSILIGGAFFHEENLFFKTIGGILLTVGIILIITFRKDKHVLK